MDGLLSFINSRFNSDKLFDRAVYYTGNIKRLNIYSHTRMVFDYSIQSGVISEQRLQKALYILGIFLITKMHELISTSLNVCINIDSECEQIREKWRSKVEKSEIFASYFLIALKWRLELPKLEYLIPSLCFLSYNFSLICTTFWF